MRIKSITIKQQVIEMPAINLLVGANNTGKSTLLREIHGALANRMVSVNDSKWLDSVQLDVADFTVGVNSIFKKVKHFEDFSQIDTLDQRTVADMIGFTPFRSNVRQNLRSYGLSTLLQSNLYSQNTPFGITLEKLQSSDSIQYTQEMQAARLLLDVGVMNEFCDTRLNMSFSTSVQDILQDDTMEQSPIRHLRENDLLLKELQTNILKVFGVKIGFDNLEQGLKPLRVLPQARFSSRLSNKDLAIKWRDESPLIDSQGDGLRAYLKLALSLLDEFSSIVLIDEPETFLHPPQRRALGSLIADIAKQHDKQVFISTHDPEFIRGLLNLGNDVKVLNLKKQESLHEIVELDLKDIKTILSQKGNSLKERATILNEAILSSLFYEKTILVEHENDRVFYEYYSSLRKSANFQNKHFIGLRGIDEVLSFMEKMHSIGINIACIVDIDFILTRYAPKFIKDADAILHNTHVAIRQEYEALSQKERKALRTKLQREGIKAIEDASQRRRYEDLIDAYGKKGVYVPKAGVLESWTKTSKNNLSEMLRIIEGRNPRELSKFMKGVLD